MTSRSFFALLIIFGIAVILSCRSEPSQTGSGAEVEAVELEEYETIVAYEDDLLLGDPYILKFSNELNHLFVYDHAHHKVLQINYDGEIEHEYGGEGRGPGELQVGRNFFPTQNHLYIIDPFRFFVHKYRLNDEFVSSMDYGELLIQEDSDAPSAPRVPFYAADISNEPFVTLTGNVLLPSLNGGRSIYELKDWQGNHLAAIGDIPEGGVTAMEDEAFRSDIENREVPSVDLPIAFPVNDRANPDELFLVYGAIPKIVKYDTTGRKLWEKSIPATPEVDTLTSKYFEFMDPRLPGDRFSLRKYIWGISSPSGELYLATHTNLLTPVETRPMWIHRFTAEGELTHRYKLISEADLLYYLDIDFSRNLILAIPFGEAEIRAYPF